MKHDIPGSGWSAMVEKTHAFGLPVLSENPFNIRPLESGEVGKLIGREELFQQLQTYLHLRSARRIMLTGPLGSGRTSLVRCLKPYAGAYASIDYLPAHAPAQSLLEMCYAQMIGGQPPSSRGELVNQLVNEMYAYSNKLPMVVIDVPASDLSVLEVALRDAHSSLERLNALIILVCDIRERHQLPATVIESFDRYQLMPFSANDVFALVQQRLASVGVMNSEFTMQDATAILEQCDGYPASVITLLRNAVDSIRMGQEHGAIDAFIDTSAKIMPRNDEDTLHALMGVEDEASPSSPAHLDTGAQMEAPSKTAEDDTHLIDASVPWDQRAESTLKTPIEDEEEHGISLPASLFDLDIDALDDAQSNDEPLQPTPFNQPIIDASDETAPKSTVVTGMFGKIAQRGWNTKSQGEREEAAGQPIQHELVDISGSSELWVDGASLANMRAEEEIPEEESAALIHDEIGLPELEESLAVQPPEPRHQIDEVPVNMEAEDDTSAEASSRTELSVMDAMEVLGEALRLLQGTPRTSNANTLVEFFERRRVERMGPRESHPLDKHLLGSLNSTDAYVVSIANQRQYSPSDATMLDHLSIKRSRLSQISNRLLKHGILQARQSGRTRKYSLTQAARAQLVAWGGLHGGDAQ